MNISFLLLVITLATGVECFKILVLYPFPSVSHQQGIMALTEELVKRGHELYVVSPNVVPELKNENYTFVDLSFSYKFISDKDDEEGKMNFQRHVSKWDTLTWFPTVVQMYEAQLLSEPFLRFKKQAEAEKLHFDVVIMEIFSIPFTCGIARLLAKNAPIISMTTLNLDYNEDNLGSMTHRSFVPSLWEAYTDKMSLIQRVENWFSDYYLIYQMKSIVERRAKDFFKKTYGIEDLTVGCWTNVSLSLITSNSLYFYPRLLGPNVIELGPLHIKPPKKLPQNLQDWLDGAEKGVIYFSLGSNMKSKSLPADALSNLVKFFKELPSGYRVLWKWEADSRVPGQSDNILTQKWLPQNSVLAHPKVKVFATQGGLQSFTEAVHYGVPTAGIPWFGDQRCNTRKMVDTGIGVQLLPQDLLLYERIREALEAVLYDEKYTNNMKKYSAISRDFTGQAMDKAVFWVEHVARHGGASHLRPSTADTTYFQFFCLDIIFVVFVLIFIVSYIVVQLYRFLILTMISSPKLKIKQS